MHTGISIYCGLTRSSVQNLKLIEKAARLGITRLFTSLHIPETNVNALKQELAQILQATQDLRLDVCADVSPAAQKLLGLQTFTPAALKILGITTIRCDFGFTNEQIAAFSKKIHVQLNASTLTPRAVQELQSAGADFSNMDALHNFYPREHTGLAVNYFKLQTEFLHDYGFSVGAFVASQSGRRGPLFAGLPTLEKHRQLTVAKAATELAALGADSIFIGDDAPTDTELQALAAVRTQRPFQFSGHPAAKITLSDAGTLPPVILPIKLLTSDAYLLKFLQNKFSARLDPAQDAIRTRESRELLHGLVIEPDATATRPKTPGAITLDNKKYLRYMGELQILTCSQAPDPRTNVVAQVVPEALPFLQEIIPGRKFILEAK